MELSNWTWFALALWLAFVVGATWWGTNTAIESFRTLRKQAAAQAELRVRAEMADKHLQILKLYAVRTRELSDKIRTYTAAQPAIELIEADAALKEALRSTETFVGILYPETVKQ